MSEELIHISGMPPFPPWWEKMADEEVALGHKYVCVYCGHGVDVYGRGDHPENCPRYKRSE